MKYVPPAGGTILHEIKIIDLQKIKGARHAEEAQTSESHEQKVF